MRRKLTSAEREGYLPQMRNSRKVNLIRDKALNNYDGGVFNSVGAVENADES
jgi:hypothetical protein